MAAKSKQKTEKPISEILVDQAMRMAGEQGWENISFLEIVRAGDVPFDAVVDLAADKGDILVLLGRIIDRRVAGNLSFGGDDPVISERDRLFDIFMDRFDVLNDYRAGILSVLDTCKFDPKQVVVTMPYLCKSMVKMLELGGVDTGGVRGMVKVSAMSAIYLKTLRVWRDDESADLSKTMAELDKNLERAEQFANSFGF